MKTQTVVLVVAVMLCASGAALAAEPVPAIKPPGEKKAPPETDGKAVAPAAIPARDAVELMDGSQYTGTVIYHDASSVGFKTAAGEKFVFPWSSIASARRADGTAIIPAPSPASPATAGPSPEGQEPGAVEAPYQAPKGRKKRAAQAQEMIGDYPRPPVEALEALPPPTATPQTRYDERSISPTLALVLELFPGLGVGNFYARNHGWGVIELASYALLIAGIAAMDDNAAQGWVFVSTALAARVGGIVMAPLAAVRYNDNLKKELRLTLPGGRDAGGPKGLALGVEF